MKALWNKVVPDLEKEACFKNGVKEKYTETFKKMTYIFNRENWRLPIFWTEIFTPQEHIGY